MTAEDKIFSLRQGNALLIDALMGLVNVCFMHDKDHPTFISHDFDAAKEKAILVLKEAGFVDELADNVYVLNFQKIKAYKKELNIND